MLRLKKIKSFCFAVKKAVKNTRQKAVMDLFIGDNSKPRCFEFESPALRESFCQMLHFMKKKHSRTQEPNLIDLFIGTWNQGKNLATQQYKPYNLLGFASLQIRKRCCCTWKRAR